MIGLGLNTLFGNSAIGRYRKPPPELGPGGGFVMIHRVGEPIKGGQPSVGSACILHFKLPGNTLQSLSDFRQRATGGGHFLHTGHGRR